MAMDLFRDPLQLFYGGRMVKVYRKFSVLSPAQKIPFATLIELAEGTPSNALINEVLLEAETGNHTTKMIRAFEKFSSAPASEKIPFSTLRMKSRY